MRMAVDLRSVVVLSVAIVACSCSTPEKPAVETRFRSLSSEQTGVDFVNRLDYTEELNTYTFRNFYNGGGVGIGDFDNDGLPDIFFSGNMVSNKLYLNLGELKFRDVTDSAGLTTDGVWTTGVSVVDINADGFLDIYLCKSGPPGGSRRSNELFINNQNLTFSENAAKYGLDFKGLSTHAAFFDYDRDGDLDCYLLNNSIRSIGGYDLRRDQRNTPDPLGGNKLLRNDDGKFVDVSTAAGIYSSEIGFGLGVTIGDINGDGWPDMFVSNDFFEKDYLYLNQQDGTFREALEECMPEISLGSMGADMADINNDGLPEVFVTEMLPATDERLKTTSQFESWDRHQNEVQQGYHRQFSRNVLQLNNGDGTFSEIGRFAGVHATDWSWGALIFDMDNNGWKDIFVANGIYKDLLDQDYVNFIANPDLVREIILKERNVIKRLIDSIPTNMIPNFAFRNRGDLTFEDMTGNWGLSMPDNSNGSAYADLDNDGDLDLILNNVNQPSQILENRTTSIDSTSNWLRFNLKGVGQNRFAVGAKVMLLIGDQDHVQELSPMRGFMSSVDYRLTFGLDSIKQVEYAAVRWPDGKMTVLGNIPANTEVVVSQEYGRDLSIPLSPDPPGLLRKSKLKGVLFVHRESDYSDFDRERLLFNMISNEGPCLCTGDINDDGHDDFYVGGAKGQAGELYVQQRSGSFVKSFASTFEVDKDSEDTGCLFFDADGKDGPDLYVASGGTEFSTSSGALLDRLYINGGKGKGFFKSNQLLPSTTRFESTAAVSAGDYDLDGDQDLFVGVRVIPGLYGVPPGGYLLTNDGGRFSDITEAVAPGLRELGMITASAWADVNSDGSLDLIVVGDWMPIRIFVNAQGRLTDQSSAMGFSDSDGWYHSLEVADLNDDGKMDLIAGNHGLNSRFKASPTEPLRMYVNDFDQNGTVEQIITRYENGKSLPFVLRPDLVGQIPSLKKKYLHFDSYKGQTMTDIFADQQLSKALIVQSKELQTAAWLNNGTGQFKKMPLPLEAQFFPVYSILALDFDGDGKQDILLGGNLSRAKPETGTYDAGYGLLLKGDGLGNFEVLSQAQSGVSLRGEIRSLRAIKVGEKNSVLVARNNEPLELIEND